MFPSSSLRLLVLGPSSLFATVYAQTTVNTNCPLQGAVFPPSKTPGTTDVVKSFQASFSDVVANFLSESGADNQTTSFSVQVFTGFDDQTLVDYHYAAPGLNGSLTGGSLNKDTTYRIGSATKLFTAYAWLLESGFSYFESPITDFIPELKNIATASDTDDADIDQVSWGDVTVGGLLSHMGGLGRDLSFLDIANTQGFDFAKFGLPRLNASEIPSCGVGNNLTICSREDYFKLLNQVHPVVQPWAKPIYSNIGYALLGIALENITGLSFDAAFNRSVVEPLGLAKTSISLPVDLSNALIPPGDDATAVMFYLQGAQANPGAALYTTPSEFASLGRSILNSTLLSKRQTRQWMKPLGFISTNNSFIGAPWEIYRYELPLSPDSNITRVMDWYTKRGDIGAYSSVVALDIEHNIGFTINAAGAQTEGIIVGLGSLLSAELAAKFEAAAREEASRVFVGAYSSADGTSNLTIALDEDRPGLGVASWFSNGVDFLQSLQDHAGAEGNTSVRLYSTQLGRMGKIGFRAEIQFLPAAKEAGLFSTNCFTWAYTGTMMYGLTGIDEFLFETGCDGVATAAFPRALRTTLARVG